MRYRYPGVFPFDTSQEDLFCGRHEETDKLYMMIMSNKTVTLHANSGTGKSSLVNAALLPELRHDSEFITITVRFRGINKSQSPDSVGNVAVSALVDEVIEVINKQVDEVPEIPYLLKKQKSLWYWAKAVQFSGKSLLFIFDQFENIELYQPDQVSYFKEKLAQLFSPRMPNEYEDYFTKESPLSEEGFLNDPARRSQYNIDSDFMRRPLNTKALFVVREDKLGVLSYFSDSFPDILKKEYKLQALSIENAKLAINCPAMKEGEFISPRFEFDENAINFVMDSLLDKDTHTIDPIEIQIICSHVEKKVTSDFAEHKIQADSQTGIISIGKEYLPPINDIVTNFYNDCWATAKETLHDTITSDTEFLLAQKKIISELVVNGKRVPVYGENFQGNELLIIQELVKKGLIRKRTIEKETFFQLCHDRFIAPLLENLQVIVAKDEIENNLKLYGKLLHELEHNEKYDLYKIRVLIEEHLISEKNYVRIPLSRAVQFTSEETIDMLLGKGLLKTITADGTTLIEISHESFLAPIIKEHEIRIAREEKENQAKIVTQLELAAKNKKISDQKKKNISLVVLLGIVAIIAIVVYGQSIDEKKKNRQTPYLLAAIRTEYFNPTLSYIISRKALEISQDNDQLNNIINSIEQQYSIQLVNRRFIPANITGICFAGKNTIAAATESGISEYGGKNEFFRRDNHTLFASASNSRQTFFFRHILDLVGQKVEVVDYTGKRVALFSNTGNIADHTVAVSESGELFFIGGKLYKKGNPDADKNFNYTAQRASFVGKDQYIALANSYSGQILIYDLKGHLVKSSWPDYDYRSFITAITATADGKYLISGDTRNNIYIWETDKLDSGQKNERMVPFKKLVGHSGTVNALALSHDNKHILSGSDDKNAIIWDFNGKIITILRGHSKPIDFVQFSADNKNVLTAGKTGEVFSWKEAGISALYNQNELAVFSRFEFRALGIEEDLIPDAHLYIKNNASFNNDKNLKEKVLILVNYFGTLPDQNTHPEVANYNNALTKSISNLEERFEAIFDQKTFHTLPPYYKRIAMISYAGLEYKKPELLLQYESRKQAQERQIKYNQKIIDANLIDTTGFAEVKSYLNEMVNMAFDYEKAQNIKIPDHKIPNYNDSLRTSIANYSKKVLSAYVKKQPSLGIEAAVIFQTIADFYDWDYDFGKSATHAELALTYSDYVTNEKTYENHFMALYAFAKTNQLEKAKQLFDTIWNKMGRRRDDRDTRQEFKQFLLDGINSYSEDANDPNIRKLTSHIIQKK